MGMSDDWYPGWRYPEGYPHGEPLYPTGKPNPAPPWPKCAARAVDELNADGEGLVLVSLVWLREVVAQAWYEGKND